MENKRQFTRILFSITAKLEVEEHTYPVLVHDISFNGALISSPGNKESFIGKSGKLSFQFVDDKSEVTTHISIVHENEYEIGLRFNSIDIDGVAHLRRLIELNYKSRR